MFEVEITVEPDLDYAEAIIKDCSNIKVFRKQAELVLVDYGTISKRMGRTLSFSPTINSPHFKYEDCQGFPIIYEKHTDLETILPIYLRRIQEEKTIEPFVLRFLETIMTNTEGFTKSMTYKFPVYGVTVVKGQNSQDGNHTMMGLFEKSISALMYVNPNNTASEVVRYFSLEPLTSESMASVLAQALCDQDFDTLNKFKSNQTNMKIEVTGTE